MQTRACRLCSNSLGRRSITALTEKSASKKKRNFSCMGEMGQWHHIQRPPSACSLLVQSSTTAAGTGALVDHKTPNWVRPHLGLPKEVGIKCGKTFSVPDVCESLPMNWPAGSIGQAKFLLKRHASKWTSHTGILSPKIRMPSGTPLSSPVCKSAYLATKVPRHPFNFLFPPSLSLTPSHLPSSPSRPFSEIKAKAKG